MPEWLETPFDGDVGIPFAILVARLAVGFLLGCIVAGVYRLTAGKRGPQSTSLMATLVLLTVLIGMVTLVIGNSVARAFSLVGALAIVRFRTVVEDTRDTAFVIFAVAVGMAVGAGYMVVPLVGIPLTAAAAFLFRPRTLTPPGGRRDFTLNVRVGVGHNPEELLRQPLGKYLSQCRLISTGTARQGASLDVTYAVRLRNEDAAVTLVSELNGIQGVQEVGLRQG
jgi:uncharacterized membrane protein YhiD involved in acid resistance